MIFNAKASEGQRFGGFGGSKTRIATKMKVREQGLQSGKYRGKE